MTHSLTERIVDNFDIKCTIESEEHKEVKDHSYFCLLRNITL